MHLKSHLANDGHFIQCIEEIMWLCWYAMSLEIYTLIHWGRVMHIYISKLSIIGSDNGLSPDRRQAIIWTNAGMLLIRTLGTNFSDFLSQIRAFSFKKMHLKMSSGKWRPSCLGLNVLNLSDDVLHEFLHNIWWIASLHGLDKLSNYD